MERYLCWKLHYLPSGKHTALQGCLTDPKGDYGKSVWKNCKDADVDKSINDCAELTADDNNFLFEVYIHQNGKEGWVKVVWTNDKETIAM